jgi:hypothetical protein
MDMVTFGIKFTSSQAMRDFIRNNTTILENVGIANDHTMGFGGIFPDIELKCKLALGVPTHRELSLTGHFGQESNCYWCSYANDESPPLWRYGVVFDVMDDNKGIMLKLALS